MDSLTGTLVNMTVTYQLAKYLLSILGPLSGKSYHRIVNSEEHLRVSRNEILVSFDVESLWGVLHFSLFISNKHNHTWGVLQ